jgi:RNA-directed DNA polymerase
LARWRWSQGAGLEIFTSFLPAVSKQALGNMSRSLRRWRLHLRMSLDLTGLAERINPIVRGWMQYYGTFYRSALDPLLRRINAYLVRFLRRKYRRLRRFTKVKTVWQRIIAEQPSLFAHWRWQTAF